MQPDWGLRTVAVIRAIADDFALADTTEFLPLMRRSIDRIEAPPNPLHHPRFRLMLVDLCGTIVRAIQARDCTSCSCHAAAWEHLSIVTRLDDDDPRTAFRNWAELFLTHVAANHPPTAAQEAATLIRSDPGKTWTLRELADTIGAHHGRLNRQFKKLFGLRPAAYVHLVRVSQAVGLFRTSAKVEAIASDVGYRSKKDFYAALKRWVGLTPAELRELSDEESHWLVKELRRRCLPSSTVKASGTQKNPDRYRSIQWQRDRIVTGAVSGGRPGADPHVHTS
jgi:AraC-like DNA-binding protein